VVPLLDAGADSLVLGCTHFPFLTPSIYGAIRRWAAMRAPDQPALSYNIKIIDPSPAVARQTVRVRDQFGLACPGDAEERHEFWTTGDAALFGATTERLLPEHDPIRARHVPLDDAWQPIAPASEQM
jgi:glutamate racemase